MGLGWIRWPCWTDRWIGIAISVVGIVEGVIFGCLSLTCIIMFYAASMPKWDYSSNKVPTEAEKKAFHRKETIVAAWFPYNVTYNHVFESDDQGIYTLGSVGGHVCIWLVFALMIALLVITSQILLKTIKRQTDTDEFKKAMLSWVVLVVIITIYDLIFMILLVVELEECKSNVFTKQFHSNATVIEKESDEGVDVYERCKWMFNDFIVGAYKGGILWFLKIYLACLAWTVYSSPGE